MITLTLTLIALASNAQAEPTPLLDADNCQTTREFVTTVEFLRSDADFKPKEQDARDLAFKVAAGCTGAAKRFIRVAKTLTTSGATGKDAAQTALKFALGKDSETDTFIGVFRRSIAEDSLDMDFESSLKIALQLSKEFSGDQQKVREDFDEIANFCSDTTQLGLPRSKCGTFAATIAKTGERWKDGVAKPFIRSFEYLKSEGGPSLVTADALKISEKLARQGPGAHENFTQAYQYASASSGLSLGRQEAIAFAEKMAAIAKIEEPKADPDKKSGH